MTANTRRAVLLALAERAEGAAVPDRGLDAETWKAAQPDEWKRQCSFAGTKYAGHIHTPAEKRRHELQQGKYLAPLYTASIEAAMTLVPTNAAIRVQRNLNLRDCFCEIERLSPEPIIVAHSRMCKSMPLALTAAALRALAAEEVVGG